MTLPQADPRAEQTVDPAAVRRRSTRVWLLAALCAGAVYLPTMAPGVLWGDSGEAQLRVLAEAWRDSREVARSHITYYAVAIALHKALGLEAALAANLVAALAGVVTVATVCWFMSLFIRGRLALACATALFLFSHAFWQLSTGAEVLTFSAMFLSLELAWALLFLKTGQARWLALAALANGLGWSTHNLAMLMWPAYLITLVLRHSQMPRLRLRSVAIAGCMWLVGSAPLLVLIALEYGRLGGIGLTCRSVLVGVYAQSVFNVHVTGGLVVRVMAYVVLSFPTPIVLLAGWGWVKFRRCAPPGAWLLVTVGGLSYAAFAARYTVPDQYTFMVHSYVFLVFFVAIGVEQWLVRYPSTGMRISLVVLSLTAPLAYALAPPLARRWSLATLPLPERRIAYREPYDWFIRPWRSGYRGPERYAREVLESLPNGAILLADSTILRPLAYLQGRDGLRLDVRLPDTGFQLPWQEPMRVGPENAGQFIDQGLLFSASDLPPYVPKWLEGSHYRFTPHSHVYKVVRNTPSPGG